MSRFPDVKLASENNVSVIGVVYVFEESNLHLPHRRRPAGAFCVLNIKANCLTCFSLIGIWLKGFSGIT